MINVRAGISRSSNSPTPASLEDFDFDNAPGVDKMLIDLHIFGDRDDSAARRTAPGVKKTHCWCRRTRIFSVARQSPLSGEHLW